MASRHPAAASRRTGKVLLALISRLHFYIGLLIGPFLLIAALSGIVYALTPQLESRLYHQALTAEREGEPQPLARQIEAAQRALGRATTPAAVRPAPQPGDTTRVMFAEVGLGPSEHRALFVDPINLEIRGDMTVYGTSGILPLRTSIDLFHRGLLLGDMGRIYSELAASWLWIAALGGLVLWTRHRRALSRHASSGNTSPAGAGTEALRWRHATLGAVACLFLLFFSATGLTWSQWAGGNIAELRHAWGWGTPSVSTRLGDDVSPGPADEHAEHASHGAVHGPASDTDVPLALADFDRALDAARAAGLGADRIEIVPPASREHAWRVAEIDRSWPTQVDQVALHPRNMRITDRAEFAAYPLAAKLTRWGIDLHMGTLFGWPNQLALAAGATALAVLVCWGYAMWWRRRRTTASAGARTLTELLVLLPWPVRLAVIGIGAALGVALPVMGASLALFMAVDLLRWYATRYSKGAQPGRTSR